jgi:perosamine synthetase
MTEPVSATLPLIPYARTSLSPEDAEAVAEAVRSGRLVMGPRVARFEEAVACYAGRRHAVAVTSGTSALWLALRALGAGPGWDVIVPAYTWVATWNVPHFLGARPVLADVDPATFCLSREGLERAIGASPAERRLILPVHLFGYRAGAGWLDEVAARAGAAVVGDGCCAFGGLDDGRRCGAWAAVECLSFHPRKVLTTGEGGMVLLDDDELARAMRSLRDHGAARSAEQRRQTGAGGPLVPEFAEPGMNLRMTEMQGALGAAQMARVEALTGGRRRAAALYDALLDRGPAWLRPPPGRDDPGRVLTCYVASVTNDRGASADVRGDELARLSAFRDALLQGMADEGVAARPPMVSLLDAPYTGSSRSGHDFPGTRAAAALAVGLPLYPDLTEREAERVIETLVRVGERRRG